MIKEEKKPTDSAVERDVSTISTAYKLPGDPWLKVKDILTVYCLKCQKANSRCVEKLINSAKGALRDPWLKINSALPKNIVEKIVNSGRTKNF